MSYTIIVAISENNIIGKDNHLLWHLAEDMKRFKALTTNHTIIMGRKTYDSIGRPLPNRRNIVLSSSMKLSTNLSSMKNEKDGIQSAGLEVFSSIEELKKNINHDEEVFVIGGGQIYRQFLPLADKVYLTFVHTVVEGDTSFPDLDKNEWAAIATEKLKADDKNDFDFDFIDYIRRK